MANDPGIVGVLYTLRFSYNNQKKEESQTGRPYNRFWNFATHNQRISLVGNMCSFFFVLRISEFIKWGCHFVETTVQNPPMKTRTKKKKRTERRRWFCKSSQQPIIGYSSIMRCRQQTPQNTNWKLITLEIRCNNNSFQYNWPQNAHSQKKKRKYCFARRSMTADSKESVGRGAGGEGREETNTTNHYYRPSDYCKDMYEAMVLFLQDGSHPSLRHYKHDTKWFVCGR